MFKQPDILKQKVLKEGPQSADCLLVVDLGHPAVHQTREESIETCLSLFRGEWYPYTHVLRR